MHAKTAHVSALIAISLSVIAASRRTAAQTPDLEEQSAYARALPDAHGKAATIRMCGSCHDIEEVGVARLSRKGWEAKVDEMFRVGATGTDQEVALVVDYLFATFPARLDVNKAIPMDFRRYLSLSEREGDIIVAYRQQHGPFKRWEDLELVPGIDFRKIKERSEILFAGS